MIPQVLRPSGWSFISEAEQHARSAPWLKRGCFHDPEAIPKKRRYPHTWAIKTLNMSFQWRTVLAGYSMVLRRERTRGFDFSVVVRARTDVILTKALPTSLALRSLLGQRAVAVVGVLYLNSSYPTESYASDQFALAGREAARAYFTTLDQYDCIAQGKLCNRTTKAPGVPAFAYDCMEGGRDWCNIFGTLVFRSHLRLHHRLPDMRRQSECRLNNQLRTHHICVCRLNGIDAKIVREAGSSVNSSMPLLAGDPMLLLSSRERVQTPQVKGPPCCVQLNDKLKASPSRYSRQLKSFTRRAVALNVTSARNLWRVASSLKSIASDGASRSTRVSPNLVPPAEKAISRSRLGWNPC